jgi:hypothetical protein
VTSCQDAQQNLETNRKILLLSELFKEFPTTPINIDTKLGDISMLEKISALIKGAVEGGKEGAAGVWGRVLRDAGGGGGCIGDLDKRF